MNNNFLVVLPLIFQISKAALTVNNSPISQMIKPIIFFLF